MEEIHAVIFDFDPISGLGGETVKILARAKRPKVLANILVDHVSIEWRDFTARWKNLIAQSKIEAVLFMVFPSALLRQTSAIGKILSQVLPDYPVVIVTDVHDPEQLFTVINLGADDYLTPPFKECDVQFRVWRLLKHKEQSRTPEHHLRLKLSLKQLIGECAAFRRVVDHIPLVARCDTGVLIEGETGTGKEICARAIHYSSPRHRYPFVPVNCGAIPAELVENELFGHERGAFTGAETRKPGLLKEATGGTLFLDEVDSLPLSAQSKFLRVLQEKEYRPLGSTKMLKADVRVIAATNIDCDEAVSSGRLRQDLYYRLNVINLKLPSLRERRSDIPLLSKYFLEKYAAEFKRPKMSLTNDALQRLGAHDWPGNVRQLENLIARAVALAESEVIRAGDLGLPAIGRRDLPGNFQAAKAACVAQFERDYIQALLRLNQGNITKAARAAEKNRRAFWELIRKHRIDVQQFKRNNLDK